MAKLLPLINFDRASLIIPSIGEIVTRPLYNVPAGYPSAAQDYMEQELDLNVLLLGDKRHKHPSKFFFRVDGESMIGEGILPGDIIVVDRAIDAKDGHIVVASLYGEYTCKFYRVHKGKPWLVPANPVFRPIEITDAMDFQIFGVFDGGLARKRKIRNAAPFTPPKG